MATDDNLPQLPHEILLQVIRFADDRTLSSLRLTSRVISQLATPLYAQAWLGSVYVFMTESELLRFQKICDCTSFAQYIRTITFETLNPSDRGISQLDTKDNPLLDRQTQAAVSILHRSLKDYEILIRSGRMTKAIQSAFESLRMNGNRNVEIKIQDDLHHLRQGFFGELAVIYDENLPDPDDILGLEVEEDQIPLMQYFYKFSERIPVRILLALARSGLAVKGLDLRASWLLVDYPWQMSLHCLEDRDRAKSEYLCDQLVTPGIGSSLKDVHIRMFYPFLEAEQLNFHKDCALFRVLRQATNLQSLEISASLLHSDPTEFLPYAREMVEHTHQGFDLLLNIIPKQHITRIRLGALVINAEDLIGLLRSCALGLTHLDIYDLLIYGDRRALEGFRLAELTRLMYTHLDSLQYFAANGDEEVYEDWCLKTGQVAEDPRDRLGSIL